jgi:MYXO-CTERM domain-containing protein
VGWLQANDYDLADDMDSVLAPYVSFGAHFVALRLSNDMETGDIEPLGLRYAGSKPMIPIQLTSVAATPDMRVETFVFGDARAVPDNYLHVQINEAAIDWFTGGSNYEDVITGAANEAGGQAFATDYAGPADMMRGTLYVEGRYDVAALASAADPIAFMDQIMSQGFPADGALLNVLESCITVPAGVDPQDFFNCVECYAEDIDYDSFDSGSCAETVEEFLVEPMRNAEALFDYAYLTRMTSSVSPEEMTLDPMFVVNHDMGDVSIEHKADLFYECTNGEAWSDALRRIELADGRTIMVPSEAWFWENDMTYGELLESITSYNALIIEETSAEGQPNVMWDLNDAVDEELGEFNADVIASAMGEDDEEEAGGCGCSTGAAPIAGAWWLVALIGLVSRRR